MPTTTCADEGFALGTTALSAGARRDLHMLFVGSEAENDCSVDLFPLLIQIQEN